MTYASSRGILVNDRGEDGTNGAPPSYPRRSCGVVKRGQREIHTLSPSIACTPLTVRGDHFPPPAYDLPPTVSCLLYPLSLSPRCWGGFFLVAVDEGPTATPLLLRLPPQ